jgi:alpha-beta hydrolase superfamily lysophospholipase
VRSYRTVSPLPPKPKPGVGGLFSVALSLTSRSVAVNNHPDPWSPDFPPLQSSKGLPPKSIDGAIVPATHVPGGFYYSERKGGYTAAMEDDFFLTNLELRESTETGEQKSGITHQSMKGMVLLSVLELAARGQPRGAITVLHDAGDCGDRYRGLAEALATDSWAVALPDLRGHGRTEGPRGHSAGLLEVCRDVQEIQDHLAYRMPDQPKVLIGQGLGANYAAAFATEHPGVANALVLIAPLPTPPFAEPTKPGGLKNMFKKLTAESTGPTGYTGEKLTAEPQAIAAWDSDEACHGLISLRATQEAQRSAGYLKGLGALDIPILILVGDQDPYVKPGDLEPLAQGRVRLEVLPGQRHHPVQGVDVENVYARIRGFLDESLGE